MSFVLKYIPLIALAFLLSATPVLAQSVDFTNFDEYAIDDNPPSDWLKRGTNTSLDWIIDDETVSETFPPQEGEHLIRHTNDTANEHQNSLEWITPGIDNDYVNVIARVKIAENCDNHAVGVIVRGQDIPDDETYGYTASVGCSTNNVSRADGNTDTTGIFSDSASYAEEEWIFIRMEFSTEGDNRNIRAKFWQAITSEPQEWQFEQDSATTPIYGPGYIGLYVLSDSGINDKITEWDCFGYSFSEGTLAECEEQLFTESDRLPILSYDWIGELGTFSMFLLITIGLVSVTIFMSTVGVPSYVIIPVLGAASLLLVILEIVALWLLFAAIFIIGIFAILLLLRQRSRSE